MLIMFLYCRGQDNFLKPFYEIKLSESDTLSTKKIESIFSDTTYYISELDKNQKRLYLKDIYPETYSSLALNAFFVSYIKREKYYSIFIKVNQGDSQHEIILINVDKKLNYIDSIVVHGGFHHQPEELEDGTVRWYIDNYSLLVENCILYYDIQLYSEGFYEDAKEWTEEKVDTFEINYKGNIKR